LGARAADSVALTINFAPAICSPENLTRDLPG
jgi:hypothetical protein